MKHGPNVKKLIIRKMSLIAIPPGGGFTDGLRFLSDPPEIFRTVKEATQWVEEAIGLVMSSKDNPYGDDTEAIAGKILEGILEREKQQKKARQCQRPSE